MTALAFASTSLRRILRDRTALFFIVVLPVLVILVVGLTVGGDERFRVGLVDGGAGRGAMAGDLVERLRREPSLRVKTMSSPAAAATAVRRGEIAVAVVVPDDLDARVLAGGTATITLLGEAAASTTQAARTAIESAVTTHAARLDAARLVATAGAGGFSAGLTVAAEVQSASPASIAVRAEVVNGNRSSLPGGYTSSAPTMLVLLVFINSLAFGAALIETRRLGIHARASASPATASSIVAGETLTYMTIALGQALLIIVIGAVLFGVRWGDPIAAGALVVVWALVGSAAGLLSGTVFRTSEQASAIGPALGMGLGMLGGCMWPLEIVGSTMRTIGHVVPHAWAVDAWTQIIGSGASIGDVARPLMVLVTWAVVLLALATTRLRRRLTS